MIRIGFCANGAPHDVGNVVTSHPAFFPTRETPPGGSRQRKCPAISEYLMSAFSVGIGYDLRFRINETHDGKYAVEFDDSATSLPPNVRQQALNLDDVSEGIVQLRIHPFWLFISDTPNVVMSIQPAIGQTNPEPIRGQFDIYKWFRAVSYSFNFIFGEWVNVSSSSPIYQVKFFHPTETHFVVSEVEKTPEIFNRERYSLVHTIIGTQSMQSWRNIFSLAGMRRPRRVLRFIESANNGR